MKGHFHYPQCAMDTTRLQTFSVSAELSDDPQWKRLTFSPLLASPRFFFFLPSVFLFIFISLSYPYSSVSDYPLSCFPPSLLFSPFPLPSYLSFIRRAGSGVTNYSEGAEKVAWALPSGLPCCITIRELAGTQQLLAAGTTTITSAPAPGRIDSARFKPSSCLSG